MSILFIYLFITTCILLNINSKRIAAWFSKKVEEKYQKGVVVIEPPSVYVIDNDEERYMLVSAVIAFDGKCGTGWFVYDCVNSCYYGEDLTQIPQYPYKSLEKVKLLVTQLNELNNNKDYNTDVSNYVNC